MRIRLLFAFFSIFLAAGLIATLIAYSGVQASEIGRAIFEVPLWLLAAVFALTIANQWLGVMRWQAANRWFLSSANQTPLLRMFEVTTWGALLGQVLPSQLSMTSARWIAMRKSSSVGITLYEQLFDIVILGAGGIAAGVLLFSSYSAGFAFALFATAIAAGCLSIRFLFRTGHSFARSYGASDLLLHKTAARLAEPLNLASQAPLGVLVELTGWSIARMVLLATRLILIALAFAPGLEVQLVAIGYPIVGLTGAVPILPGGLGLTEWSLTGLLVHAGAQGTAAAALIAIVVRLIVLAALVVICAVLLPVSLLFHERGDKSASQKTASPAGN